MQRCTWMGVAIGVVGLLAKTIAQTSSSTLSITASQSAVYNSASAGQHGPDTMSGIWANNPLGNERSSPRSGLTARRKRFGDDECLIRERAHESHQRRRRLRELDDRLRYAERSQFEFVRSNCF